jgi:hypothetical protein
MQLGVLVAAAAANKSMVLSLAAHNFEPTRAKTAGQPGGSFCIMLNKRILQQ